MSSGRACSIGIILLGSIWYTWIKHEESQAPKPGYERVTLEKAEEGKSEVSATQRSRTPED